MNYYIICNSSECEGVTQRSWSRLKRKQRHIQAPKLLLGAKVHHYYEFLEWIKPSYFQWRLVSQSQETEHSHFSEEAKNRDIWKEGQRLSPRLHHQEADPSGHIEESWICQQSFGMVRNCSPDSSSVLTKRKKSLPATVNWTECAHQL